MITYMELMGPEMAEIAHIRVDRLSMLMCVIILICCYNGAKAFI